MGEVGLMGTHKGCSYIRQPRPTPRRVTVCADAHFWIPVFAGMTVKGGSRTAPTPGEVPAFAGTTEGGRNDGGSRNDGGEQERRG